MKNIEQLKIFGRRWFQKSYGNTYHTVELHANGEYHKSDITYGYDNHYLSTAADVLKTLGYDIPDNPFEAYSLMLSFPHTVVDVNRKKDL